MLNQLAIAARADRTVATPLQREVDHIIRFIVATWYALLMVPLMVGAWVEGRAFVDSVAVALVVVGLVPQGLFLAIATAYALGSVRIARKGALVQRPNAVEKSLSNVDVLCLDKTGTLTDQPAPSAKFAGRADEAAVRPIVGDFVASVGAPNKTTVALVEGCPGRARAVEEEVPFASERRWSGLCFTDELGPAVCLLGAPDMLRPHLGRGPGGARRADRALGRRWPPGHPCLLGPMGLKWRCAIWPGVGWCRSAARAG